MVIDTSAVAAILFGEDDAPRLAAAIAADPLRLVSAATALECTLVIESALGEAGARELDLLLLRCAAEIVPFNAEQLAVARHAYRTYGKGRHAAGLNYGGCFSYALSATSGEPLLCKGGDFAKTDAKLVSL